MRAQRATRVGFCGAILLMAGGGGLASVGLGIATVALAIVTWVCATQSGSLFDRLAALLVISVGLVCALGLVGPLVGAFFTPFSLGAALCAPGAVAVAMATARQKGLRLPALDLDTGLIAMGTGVSATLFCWPFRHRSPAALLAAMTNGGVDYLAHFDLMEQAWRHHGFLFVNTNHAVLEHRPHLAASPYGAHVTAAGLSMVISGNATLPGAPRTLMWFSLMYVGAATLMVLVFGAATVRVLRAAQVGRGPRAAGVIVVTAAGTVGAFGSLYVLGFFSYLLAMACAFVGIIVVVCPQGLRWRQQAFLLGSSTVVVAFTYTLLLPVMALVCVYFLLLTRPAWHRDRGGRRIVVGLSVVVGSIVLLAVLPTLASSSALGDKGEITHLNLQPFAVIAACAVLDLLYGRGFPRPVRHLTGVAYVTTAFVLLFGLGQLIAVGHIRYYGQKLEYFWLATALLALVSEIGWLLPGRPGRRGTFIALIGATLLWTAGLFPEVQRLSSSARVKAPAALALAFPGRFDPTVATREQARAETILAAARAPGPRLRLIWAPSVGNVTNRWVAIMRRQWDGVADDLILRVGAIDRGTADRLVDWVREHPGVRIRLYAVDSHWLGNARVAAARAGPEVSVSQLPLGTGH